MTGKHYCKSCVYWYKSKNVNYGKCENDDLLDFIKLDPINRPKILPNFGCVLHVSGVDLLEREEREKS